MAEKYDVPAIPKSRPAVVWWAWIGGAWLVFWAYVLTRWVTGPYFVSVPVGPVEPAGWSKAIMDTWQILSLPLLALGGYFMIYRPYKKTRNVPLDGLLLIAFVFFSLQDAGSNYLGIWYTVNSYMLNMGSFYNEIPGWLGFGRPGAVVPYAYLFHITEYPLGLFTFCFIGSGLMNFARKRWNWGPVKLIIFIFPFMMLYDLVIEGTFQTLGLYTMAGGKISFFPDTYEKFPLIEMIWIACLNIPVLALRYFKNDKGETIVERGINSMVISDLKKQVVRCLALIGVCQTIFLTCYNIPVALTMGSNPGEWPSDIVSRPYLTDGLCGPGTDRLCPGPGVPLTQQAWVTTRPAGEIVPEETWNSRFWEPSVGKALRRDDGKKNPELTDGKYRKYRPFNSQFLGYSKDRCNTLLCIEGREPNLP
ncbi:MAG: spirocyclase AveC family protein [Proteobacteria bacterium]|nr:spirocyclase AveC family protein [Pseudomonadota bacterium]